MYQIASAIALQKILMRKKYERVNYLVTAAADLRPPSPPPPPVAVPAVAAAAKEPAPPDQTAAVLISPDSIELGEVLGEGAHGSVHKGNYHWNQELVGDYHCNITTDVIT